MKRFTTYTLAVLLMITLFPLNGVLARDFCMENNFGSIYIFRDVKALEIPGQVTPLSGIYIGGTTEGPPSGPLHGSAYVRADGSIDIGFFVHFILNGVEEPGAVDSACQFRGTFEAASGVCQTLSIGGIGEPYGVTFTGVDCRGVTIP